MNKKIILALLLLLVLLIGTIYFKQKKISETAALTSQSQTTSKLQVEATFYPLAEFARQVGGDFVEVSTLVPAGSEPHDFEPSTQDIARIHQSKVLIYNGADFELWLYKILPDLQKDRVITVNSSQRVPLLSADVTLGERSMTVDPHVWLDPVYAQQQVRAIETAFIFADPDHEKEYKQNTDKYLAELEELNQEFKHGLAICQSNTVVTSHAAFAYIAQEYNLQMIPIAGLSPDEEPSPQRLAQIAQQVKAKKIKYIFFESMVSPVLAQTMATETGAKTLVFNPLEGLTQEQINSGEGYTSIQRENLKNLRIALSCQ